MWVVKVYRLEELRRDGRGLDIEVVLGEAHQKEEGCWREYLEYQGGHATDAQKRAATASLQQGILAQDCQELPP